MWETIKSFGKIGKKGSKSFSFIYRLSPFLNHRYQAILFTETLAKTTLKFWKDIFKIIWYWLKKTPFVSFWDIWQDIYRPVIFFWIPKFFLYIGVIFANFSDVVKIQTSIMLLSLCYIKLENMSVFFIILVGISSSCDTFEASMFFISLITSSFVIWLKVNKGSLLIFLFIAKIPGCLRYFKIR